VPGYKGALGGCRKLFSESPLLPRGCIVPNASSD